MIVIVFCIMCGMMILISGKVSKRLINVVSVLGTPYLIIIPLNNFVMYRLGFFLISDSVVLMILLAITCVFIGEIICDIRKIISFEKGKGMSHGEWVISHYNVMAMARYAFAAEVLQVIRLAGIIRRRGISYLGTEDFSGVMFGGIIGHLFLIAYPMIPIIFYYWLKNKKKIGYLIITIIGTGICFSTFVKYHTIGLVLLIYIFVSIEDSQYTKKGALIVAALGFIFFASNYFISFAARDSLQKIKQNYYVLHFWNYSAGSLIHDNWIFTEGIRIERSIFYKLGTFLCTPINVFINAFLGFKLFPHEGQARVFLGPNREIGNVVDALGYLYPSKGSVIDIFFYGMVLLVIGFVFTSIYEKALANTFPLHITLSIFLTFFIAFSFFGTFYVTPVCWEIMFWSIMILPLFDDRIKIKIRR